MDYKCVLITLATFVAKSSGFGAGEYEYLEVEEVTPCPDIGSEWKVSANLKNVGGNMQGAVNFTLGVPLDETVALDFLAESSSPAGWQPFYPYEDSNVCEAAMEQFPEVMNELYDCLSLPRECPFPQGNHVCTSLPLRYHFKLFEELPYGKFRGTIKLLVNGEIKLCATAIANVVAKERDSAFKMG